MKEKKASLPLYVIVGIIIALVALILYSFFAQGVIYEFMQNVGAIESDINESMQDALGSGNEKDSSSNDESDFIEGMLGG